MSKKAFLIIVAVTAILLVLSVQPPEAVEKSESDFYSADFDGWRVFQKFNQFTAVTQIDDLDWGSNSLFIDHFAVINDKNDMVSFSNIRITREESGSFTIRSDFIGDMYLRTEKINTSTEELIVATALQKWEDSRTFTPEEIELAPGESLRIILSWTI